QIFVHRAKAVSGPGADGRVAAELVAGVEMIESRGMVDALGLRAAIDAKIVCALGEVLEIFTDVHARRAGLAELERALDEVTFSPGHGGGEFASAKKFLQMQLGEPGLGIKRINMTWPAFHEEKDAGPGPGGNHLRFRGEDAGVSALPREHRGERQPAEAVA